MKPAIDYAARDHLEWREVLDALATHCLGPISRARVADFDFPNDRADLERRLRLVTEARALVDRGMAPPIGDLPDARYDLGIASRGGVLDAEPLRDIGHVAESASRCRRFLAGFAEDLPTLFEIAGELADLPDLARALLDSIDAEGRIADSASDELGLLRNKVTSHHTHLKETVHGLLSNEEYEGLLQDEYFTIRDDRYVLPIRAGHKRHVPGVVHGWSQTGQTVYIEPQVVVDANNRLLMAQADVDREIRRILSDLSQRVGQNYAALAQSVSALAELDFLFAAARLSKQFEATPPVLDFEATTLSLRRARHPMLILSGLEVVPNDIDLDAGRRVLVVTGPNTGGKTVVLKTAGLCTLLALAGLHIPADAGSTVPVVPGVYTDIGDSQSIAQALSTFSGHITNIIRIFDRVQPRSLVLLDELVVGTDPVQGAALAQAILEALADREAMVLVTTHYESLKALPFTDRRFRNGAVGFDGAQKPTYELRLDLPGSSSAFQIARRLGLDGAAIDRAAELAGPHHSNLERVIQSLESDAEAARKERQKLETVRREAEAERRALAEQSSKLKERLAAAVARERDRALDAARKLRDEVKALERALRDPERRRDIAALGRTRVRAEQVIEQVVEHKRASDRAKTGPAIDPASLSLGQKVYVVALASKAELTRLPDARGRAEVRIGAMTCRVAADDLRSPGDAPPKPKEVIPHARPRPKSTNSADWADAPPQTPDNTVDVRGARADEAIERVEQFLDAQISRDGRVAYVIHGHGTGALKKQIRDYLRNSRYAVDFRRGATHEGGDGVTAALLI